MLGGQHKRTNEDGAATEELAKLGAVGVGGELCREPDRGDFTFQFDFESFLVLHAERPRLTAIEEMVRTTAV